MPELPEVEITARLLDRALAGARVESAVAPGINALRTFAPPLDSLVGTKIESVGRRGKRLIVGFDSETWLLIHLMSAGRLQLFDQRCGPRDRTSRVLVRIDDGRELRLREFGTKQAAWAKLLSAEDLAGESADLGPEAWPELPADFATRIRQPRPLHSALRDQHVVAGIGRSWVDEILWTALLSPFKRGVDLDAAEVAALASSVTATLGGAIEHYEKMLALPIPDKLPMPLLVHRRVGEPCPRCATPIEAVNFEDYVMCYCPTCQTDGRVLKDRRLSRLLK
jgi:formamidopyrimidine-DNA glycosylase